MKNTYIYWNGVVYVVKNKLKEIRMREYMMDQKQFYTMLGISKSTYSQIENNKQQGNIETVLKIAKALSRPVEEIWFLED
nr:helix-turn-helix domain-containing protein [Clostridium sporogenes]